MTDLSLDNIATPVVTRSRRTRRALLGATILCCAALGTPAIAQTAVAEPDGTDTGQDIVVTGSLNALPNKDVGSIFGFNKTLVETPRSASTICS